MQLQCVRLSCDGPSHHQFWWALVQFVHDFSRERRVVSGGRCVGALVLIGGCVFPRLRRGVGLSFRMINHFEEGVASVAIVEHHVASDWIQDVRLFDEVQHAAPLEGERTALR